MVCFSRYVTSFVPSVEAVLLRWPTRCSLNDGKSTPHRQANALVQLLPSRYKFLSACRALALFLSSLLHSQSQATTARVSPRHFGFLVSSGGIGCFCSCLATTHFLEQLLTLLPQPSLRFKVSIGKGKQDILTISFFFVPMLLCPTTPRKSETQVVSVVPSFFLGKPRLPQA